MPTWFEREEDELVRRLNDGEITRTEYDKDMRDLTRSMRDMAAQDAAEAYNRVMDSY